jgi:5-methylcytosine-specific restriction protein A
MAIINKGQPVRPWVSAKKDFDLKTKDVNQHFYNSAVWRKLSAQYKAANPLCVNFDECGGVAEITDHIVPIRDGGDKLNWDNLQSLCKKCNFKKTGEQRWKRK